MGEEEHEIILQRVQESKVRFVCGVQANFVSSVIGQAEFSCSIM